MRPVGIRKSWVERIEERLWIFFIRSWLMLPVSVNQGGAFSWGVWCVDADDLCFCRFSVLLENISPTKASAAAKTSMGCVFTTDIAPSLRTMLGSAVPGTIIGSRKYFAAAVKVAGEDFPSNTISSIFIREHAGWPELANVTCLGLPSVGCADDIWILRLSFRVKALEHKWHLTSFLALFGLPATRWINRSV